MIFTLSLSSYRNCLYYTAESVLCAVLVRCVCIRQHNEHRFSTRQTAGFFPFFLLHSVGFIHSPLLFRCDNETTTHKRILANAQENKINSFLFFFKYLKSYTVFVCLVSFSLDRFGFRTDEPSGEDKKNRKAYVWDCHISLNCLIAWAAMAACQWILGCHLHFYLHCPVSKHSTVIASLLSQ